MVNIVLRMLSSCSQSKWIGVSQEEESRIRERERETERPKRTN